MILEPVEGVQMPHPDERVAALKPGGQWVMLFGTNALVRVQGEDADPVAVRYVRGDNEPLLGLATTKQLLEELIARGRTDATLDGQRMADDCASVLIAIPERLLTYRTVGSR